MIVTAYNNGAHSRSGAGYGFKVHPEDRDAHFKPEWKTILLEIDSEAAPVEATMPGEAFWSENGHEITHPAVGKWLRRNGIAPWPRGNPPRFILEPIEENRFRLAKAGGAAPRKP